MAADRKIPVGVYLVYLNVVLYALCYQLQKPIEPFLVKRLGASNAQYGTLQSFFSAIQTVGAPVVGVLLGRYGTRLAFVVMFLASALSYGILSLTDSMSMLYLSKVPSLLQHGFLVAQTAIADQTVDGGSRTVALGYLTTAYTIGASIGPAVGGFLGATGNYFIGAKLAVAGSLLSAFISAVAPEERAVSRTSTATESAKAAAKTNGNSGGVLGGLSEMFETAMLVMPLLATKIIVSIGNAMYQGSMPIVLRDNFEFSESDMGLYMSSFMVSSGIFSAVCVKPIADRFPGRQILVWSVGGMVTAFACKTLAGVQLADKMSYGPMAMAWLGFTFAASLSGHLLAIVITSESTTMVDDGRRGTLMGLEHGGFSAARIVGPSLGISLMSSGAFWHIDAAITVINATVLMFWLRSSTKAEKKD